MSDDDIWNHADIETKTELLKEYIKIAKDRIKKLEHDLKRVIDLAEGNNGSIHNLIDELSELKKQIERVWDLSEHNRKTTANKIESVLKEFFEKYKGMLK